jgi:hypothetical protein
MIDRAGVYWSAVACARFARRLEALVRAECRRDGCPVGYALAELWEMVETGEEYRRSHVPASSQGGCVRPRPETGRCRRGPEGQPDDRLH